MNGLAKALQLTHVSEDPKIPDDVWEQFVRDSERDIRDSAPKEPSARAREVTERLRRQEARGELPEGWRTGPAWQQKKSRRGLWSVLAVVVAAGVAVVAVKPSLVPGDPFGARTSSEAASSPLPQETTAPTAAPSAEPSQIPTLDDPFAGSPAKRWADGAAGIAVPKAKPVGGRSAAKVEQALELTKKLLVESNLDPATLRGERPRAALDVLDPLQKDVRGILETGLRKPDEKHDPLWMFSRFDPEEVRPVGDVVKTRGRMTFKAGDHASVAVHADYTFVYPVVQTNGSTEVTRTIIRRILDVEISDPAKYQVTPGKLTVVNWDQDINNSACEVYDGYLHPSFSSSDPTGPDPTGPTSDPYDRSKPLDTDRDKSCGTVSRV
ncbi:hypothetical protein [Streptomyces sviceus]|uniref:Uncharacterized protein n=1 Tax=Streptomyces sviceus (strain ATCC 29083 / DSM 924 / JCM 4929 / NBRC 13980 / NCIMB 11184 / NRRL 5439 / UC 5370) TaxID=463191 RepID=B5I8C9_STRX2|nr:conserved hypothetical protein [Streptomyces sviceus ATCC 29083]MYT07883.1 hypothetical protein [Streptomyces sp. SID5470]